MSTAASRFEAFHGEYTWAARAALSDLEAVLYAGGPERENLLMHAQSAYGAKVALALSRRRWVGAGVVLDFGCGNGRMLRFFGGRGWRVIGTEVTAEMLEAARKLGLPADARLYHTPDGVTIPVADESVDLVWVSGVLKYALFDVESGCRRNGEGPNRLTGDQTYLRIAREMHRVLRPGGLVVNVEMFVDAEPEVFRKDFEAAGFATKRVGVLRRYKGACERFLQYRPRRRLPPGLVLFAGDTLAALRYRLDDPRRGGGGYRDYLFVWAK